jgi:hypothetical protein
MSHGHAMDMESYRTAHCLTYRGLLLQLRLELTVSQVRRIALGEIWPRPPIVNAIVEGSGNLITIEAMHRRYSARYSTAA